MIFRFTCGFLILLLSGCNQILEQAKNNEVAYSYQFNVNGCDTGYHAYSSNDEMCTALKDNSLNNGCAVIERQNKFYGDCPGQTW